MRRRATTDAIPEDLRTYDPARWIKAVVEATGDPFVKHIAPEDRSGHWYVRRITAPAYYREALTDAVGQRAGDHHFYNVLNPCPYGTDPEVF